MVVVVEDVAVLVDQVLLQLSLPDVVTVAVVVVTLVMVAEEHVPVSLTVLVTVVPEPGRDVVAVHWVTVLVG